MDTNCWYFFSIHGVRVIKDFVKKREKKLEERQNFKKIFNISIYPFIWNRELYDCSRNYNMSNIQKIGGDNDQLIVFYEQNSKNDSSKIFQSLTGFIVNCEQQETTSLLFSNVNINRMMKRYMRNGKIHQSKLRNKNVNILYLKGCTDDHIYKLCKVHKNKPIFVSSCLQSQEASIFPDKQCEFYLFFISEAIFQHYLITKETYLEEFEFINRPYCNINIKFLPVYCNNYNFDNSGPFAQATIKYGCRYILKDESLV